MVGWGHGTNGAQFFAACMVERGTMYLVLVMLLLDGVRCVWSLLSSLCATKSHSMATLDLEKLVKRGSCMVCKNPPPPSPWVPSRGRTNHPLTLLPPPPHPRVLKDS